ncbi:MAG: class I SAM-dependent methyltransferase family protein [Candidatus Bathyarchaeia archaeon]
MEMGKQTGSYCVRVPKRLGEKTIKLLSKLNLLNKDLKILSLGDYLLIPLTERLSNGILNDLIKQIDGLEISFHEFPIRIKEPKTIADYLEDKLPPHLLASLPRSIDFIGDIAIIEIPEELEAHKHLIGVAILRVYKRVRSVLAKSSSVSGVYRLRDYEVIAGSDDTETVHKEHGCKYFLDPRRVYFSPRLSYEHYRIASQVQEGETVVDMFAGVGPFSILIAKMRSNIRVYAIDINPDAIKYLERNIHANGVYGKVIPILGDAKEAIEIKLRKVADRVIMNLPERALEYIDAVCIALKPSGGIIHYYRFVEAPYAVEKARGSLINGVTRAGRKVETILAERIVREVAPYKWQIAIDARIQ